MEIKLISFAEWRQKLGESSASSRAKIASFQNGTLPPMAPATVNSKASGTAFQVWNAEKVKTVEDLKEKKKSKPKAKKKSKD